MGSEPEGGRPPCTNTTKTMENIVSLVDQVGVVALAGVVGSDVVTLSRDFGGDGAPWGWHALLFQKFTSCCQLWLHIDSSRGFSNVFFFCLQMGVSLCVPSSIQVRPEKLIF